MNDGGSDASRADRRALRREERQRRNRRLRRHGRRAYIRSVYFLPSMATLGNAICGFGAIYVAALNRAAPSPDQLTSFFAEHQFIVAAYLIFLAMVFDGLDGRLARFARHTTDFGGQLDSLADVISFGAAPAFLAMAFFKAWDSSAPTIISRLVWAIGALFLSCAALRLARFNVSNKHGEQHHFSFLGLPSPAAGGTVAAWVLMEQELAAQAALRFPGSTVGVWMGHMAGACAAVLPLIVLATGLLMISTVRYPHLVNRYLRGRRSIGRLLMVLALALLLIVAHQYVLAIGTAGYVLWGMLSSSILRIRLRRQRHPK